MSLSQTPQLSSPFKEIIPALFHPTQKVLALSKLDGSWLIPVGLVVAFGAFSSLVSMRLSAGLGLISLNSAIVVLNFIGSLLSAAMTILTLGLLLYFLLRLNKRFFSFQRLFPLVAWSCLPLVVRQIVRIVYMSLGQVPILAPGLSGLAPGMNGINVFLFSVLAHIDIFLLWSCVNIYLVLPGDVAGHRFKLMTIGSAVLGMIIMRSMATWLLIDLNLSLFAYTLLL